MFGLMTRKENDRLLTIKRNRIYELEEILCPCSQHDYIKIGSKDHFGGSPAEYRIINILQCRRCKKLAEELWP